MYVTVTKNDTTEAEPSTARRVLQETQTTTLQFGAYSFVDDDKAMQLGGAFAAVAIAMISYF